MWGKKKRTVEKKAEKKLSIFAATPQKPKLSQQERDKLEYELWVRAEEYEEEDD